MFLTPYLYLDFEHAERYLYKLIHWFVWMFFFSLIQMGLMSGQDHDIETKFVESNLEILKLKVRPKCFQ